MNSEAHPSRSTLGALGLVLALLAGFAALPRVLHGKDSVRIGHDAPNFTLSVVANGTVLGADQPTLSLNDLRGKVVLLDFWATWCEPCRLEAPIIDQLSRRWRDQGLVVVGVDTDLPGQGNPAAFAQSRRLSYPIVQDATGDATHAYGVEDLPTLIVVSRSGKIAAIRTGLTDDAELDRIVRRAF
jgi:cytochrome c biogenesis protein CcmG/thiol:disulfide interchange protein DsbE